MSAENYVFIVSRFNLCVYPLKNIQTTFLPANYYQVSSFSSVVSV